MKISDLGVNGDVVPRGAETSECEFSAVDPFDAGDGHLDQ
jgi:hypothetical protein